MASSYHAEESIASSPYTRFFSNISNYASRLLFGEEPSEEEAHDIEDDDAYRGETTCERWDEEREGEDASIVYASKNDEKEEESNRLAKKQDANAKQTNLRVSNSQETSRDADNQTTRPEVTLERLKYLERRMEELESSLIVTQRRLRQVERNTENSSTRPRHRHKSSLTDASMWGDKIWKGMTKWRPFSSKRSSLSPRSSGSFRSRLLEDMRRLRHHIPLLHWSSDEDEEFSSSEHSSEGFRSSSSLPNSFVQRENAADSTDRDRGRTSIDEVFSRSSADTEKNLESRSSDIQSFTTARDKTLSFNKSRDTERISQAEPQAKVLSDKQTREHSFQIISDEPAYYGCNSFQYGNYLLWSGKLVDAASFFQKRIENKCDSSFKGWPSLPHPRDLLLYAESYMMRVWFTGSIQQASEASELFERAIEAALNGQKTLERILDKGILSNEKERQLALYDWEDCRLVIADGNLLKSIMLALAGHTLKAGITLRRGWKAYAAELDNVIQEFEQFQTCHVYTDRWEDMTSEEEFSCTAALRSIEKELCLGKTPVREYIGLTEAWMFGLGFYLLLVSLAPPAYYKVLQVLGFQANRPLGLALLEAAFSRALIKDSPVIQDISGNIPLPLSAPIAAHAIVWDLLEFYAFSSSEYELPEDRRLRRANMVCRRCLELFPDSPIWLWPYGIYQRKQGNLDRCVAQLKECRDQFEKNEGKNCPVRLVENLRYMYLLRGDLEQMEQISLQLLSKSNDSIPIGSYVCLGIVELERGNLSKADSMFQMAKSFVASRSLTDFEEFCQWKAGVFAQRQRARVVSAEVICCSLMYQSLKKEYIQPWITWLLQDKEYLESQLESHLQNNKKNGMSEDASPRVTSLFSSWKKLSKSNVTTAVRGNERSVVAELSVCYYALGTFYRLLGELATAEDYLLRVCENLNEEDPWLAMCSRFEISMVYWERRNVSLASDYLSRSLAVSRNIPCGSRAFISQIQRCKRKMKT